MGGRVIQGSFAGGLMRPAPGLAPRAAPSRAVQRAAAQPRAPAPPALAFTASARPIQRRGDAGNFEIDPVQLGLARGGGAPLPQALLAKMEAAFRADFSGVRVHVGPQAARIGAIAFTTGNDLYFAPGRYQPESVQGQQLIGHELAHVIQQRQGRVRAPGSGVAVVQDRLLEAEADRLGMRAAMHRSAASHGAQGSAVQAKLLRPGDIRSPIRQPGPPAAAFSRMGNAVQRSSLLTTTYTLKGDKPQEVLLQKLGQFSYEQGFSVSSNAKGWIIQRIRRKLTAYAVYGSEQNLLSTSQVEGFSDSKGKFLLTGWDDYYELFEVDKGSSIHVDGFALTQINPDTKHTSAGQYEISGEAYFVSSSASLGSDWKKGDKSNPANGLPFIQNAGSASSLPAAESNVLKRTVAVTWYKSADAVLKVDGKEVASLKKSAFPSEAPVQP